MGSFAPLKAICAKAPRHLDRYFTAQYFRRENYYQYDGHFNAAGHANMASIIEAALATK